MAAAGRDARRSPHPPLDAEYAAGSLGGRTVHRLLPTTPRHAKPGSAGMPAMPRQTLAVLHITKMEPHASPLTTSIDRSKGVAVDLSACSQVASSATDAFTRMRCGSLHMFCPCTIRRACSRRLLPVSGGDPILGQHYCPLARAVPGRSRELSHITHEISVSGATSP